MDLEHLQQALQEESQFNAEFELMQLDFRKWERGLVVEVGQIASDDAN